MTADISQENVAQRAQALLDRHALFEQGKESMVLSVSEAVDFARAYLALAARLAEVEAERDKLFRKAALADEWRDHDKARAEVAEARVAKLRAAFRVNMLRYGPPGINHAEIDAILNEATK